jgi:probable F420-dependent oxidoreductase
MDYGIAIFLTDETIGPAHLARLVEERGFSSLWVPEHTHIPTSRSTEWRPGKGQELPRHYWRCLDPFVALTAAAAATTTLRVGTGICLLIQRDPIVTAKEVATLDVLSDGRFEFGVGAGWNQDEIENHGTPFDRRFRVLRERVEAITAIWEQDEASYHGEFVDFTSITSWPKPVQKPHPPIYMAAYTEKAMARVARFADAWMPVGVPLEGMQAMLASIRETAASHGRVGDAIALVVRANLFITDAPIAKDRFIFTGTLEQIAEDVAATKAIGASELHFELAFGPTAPTVDDYLSMAGTLHEIGTSA